MIDKIALNKSKFLSEKEFEEFKIFVFANEYTQTQLAADCYKTSGGISTSMKRKRFERAAAELIYYKYKERCQNKPLLKLSFA